MAQYRGGEVETRHLVSWTQRSMTRQSQEEAWQRQFNNIMKTGKNKESRARQAYKFRERESGSQPYVGYVEIPV